MILFSGEKYEKQKYSKYFNICFTGFIVVFLGIGFADAVLFPEDISQYEQRTLDKLPALSTNDDIYWTAASSLTSVPAGKSKQIIIKSL